MLIDDYSKEAMKFARYKESDYPFLALAEEVGEVMGKLAKFSRKHDATLCMAIGYAKMPVSQRTLNLFQDLKGELGDVLWQLNACCIAIGTTLDEVATYNLTKLADRDARNVIVGEGDNR